MSSSEGRDSALPVRYDAPVARAYRIAWQTDPRFEGRVDPAPLMAIATRTLELEGAPEGCELGVVLTGDDIVRELNARYLGLDEPTDVLSFGLGEPFPGQETERQLGEVIISVETAERQAAEAGHDLGREIAHLLVHGVLHILGYDHAEPADERAMRAREEVILGHEAH